MSSTTEKPLISVVIVCHNDGKWLPRCLESIRKQSIFDRLELIIADNASQDGTDRLAQDIISGWQKARFFSTGGDNGFCVGANRGAALAQGTYLQILNPDTWLEPDCLEQLLRACTETGAEAAGPLLLNYDDNSLQSYGGAGFDFCGNYMPPPSGGPPKSIFCIASFFFIRKDLYFKIGGLDEKGFMYGEEMDLSWRIWIAGGRITPAYAGRIHHRGAAGVNPEGGTQIVENRTSIQKRFLANRNRLLFIAKNCQHILLLTLIPSLCTIIGEGIVTWGATRDWAVAKTSSFDSIANFWRLRTHIWEQRERISLFRRYGDFWMLRFFRFGFGRWEEVAKILKRGFPRFQ